MSDEPAIEKRSAWMAAIGVLGLFAYWCHTAFWSGQTTLDTELRPVLEASPPAVLERITGDAPRQYWAGPVSLDPDANPHRLVLSATVRRGRESVAYRVAIVGGNGVVAWEEGGTIHHAASQQKKQQSRQDGRLEKRIRQPSAVFQVPNSGPYTLLAELDRVDAPAVALRSGVSEGRPSIYLAFGALALFGSLAVLRGQWIRRAPRNG
ncbi:MAG: hypothetical protein V2J02_21935 [Pseudomonadales bacterium]|jgi:hypothetical protein|nr:hypothetical protein [Pseudomonadales bacterium]